jgi:hypothetical protein
MLSDIVYGDALGRHHAGDRSQRILEDRPLLDAVHRIGDHAIDENNFDHG